MEAREEFMADGWRVKSAWTLALCTPPLVATMLWRYFRPDAGSIEYSAAENFIRLLQPISLAAIWFCMVWGLAHLRRPVVSIGDRDVEFGSIFRFGSRPSLLLDDIAEIEVKPRSLRLRTRPGLIVLVRMPELSSASRAAVHTALKRRIHRSPAGRPNT
jgi:hypothetical protein